MSLNDDEIASLESIYRKHREQVFLTCMRFAAGDRQWAMDRMQEVFVTVAERFDQVESINSLDAWLHRVTVNRCFTQLRRTKRWSLLQGSIASIFRSTSRSPAAQILARDDLHTLEKSLQRLRPAERAVFVLVNMEDRKQSEVADLLGLSKGQVSKLLARAMEKLRGLGWSAYGWSEDGE
ncbi:MAG: sigma-70 family RNA polymerase sigma factor [Myxococcota bacterium]